MLQTRTSCCQLIDVVVFCVSGSLQTLLVTEYFRIFDKVFTGCFKKMGPISKQCVSQWQRVKMFVCWESCVFLAV